MHYFKLISLNMTKVKVEDTIASAESLLQRLKSLNPSDVAALNAFIQDVRQAGLPLTKLAIKKMVRDGSLAESLDLLINQMQLSEAKLTEIKALEQQIEMIDIPKSNSRIMKGEVTVGLFKQVMEGEIIDGLYADVLQSFLDDPAKQNEPLTFLNLMDANIFAARLSKITGRKFRIQTDREWRTVKDQLTGTNYTWSEQVFGCGTYSLLSLSESKPGDSNNALFVWHRGFGSAIRLVEDRSEPAIQIAIPETIYIPESSSRIMKGEVSVGLFKQVMQGYEFTGDKADKLKAILADPTKENESVVFVNLLDAREFARRLTDLTGRIFRVQTDKEWIAAKDQLIGHNWTWTETKRDDEKYIVRHQYLGFDIYAQPDKRCEAYAFAFRLVEDPPIDRQENKDDK